jgi:hypothetical protein
MAIHASSLSVFVVSSLEWPTQVGVPLGAAVLGTACTVFGVRLYARAIFSFHTRLFFLSEMLLLQKLDLRTLCGSAASRDARLLKDRLLVAHITISTHS